MTNNLAPRTIAQIHRELLAADPDCALTLTALRRLVRTNQIRSCRIGVKYLVTHEAVADYLRGDNNSINISPDPSIRKADDLTTNDD